MGIVHVVTIDPHASVGASFEQVPEEPSGELLLRMGGICKEYPGGVIANRDVTFELRKGEVHALLGENGAGKTTLMNLLYGLVQPDSGSIFLNGKAVTIHSPRDAIEHGIGMVHQRFMLIPQLTVAENVILGIHSGDLRIDWSSVERQIQELSEQLGLRIEPGAKVADIPLGMQQRVEILKALYRGASLLVLDEPTAVLTPREVEELITTLRRLVEEGRSIIFISHKLGEVLAVSDRITVLRDGQVVGTIHTKDTDRQTLARMMVGREVHLHKEGPPPARGGAAIELEGVCAHDDRGAQVMRNVDLVVYTGEILGIAGVDGNGQGELAEIITGIRKPTKGVVRIFGESINGKSTRDIQRLGVGYIPEDRDTSGLIHDFTVEENLVLEAYPFPPYSRAGFLRPSAIRRTARRLIETFSIKAPSPKTQARTLSGGNQQRIILARTLALSPRIIIAAQPTRGLDIAATEYVRHLLVEQCNKGAAILLISTELDEVLDLSERIAVLYDGQVMGIISRESFDIDRIGRMMTGTPLSSL